MKRYAIVPLDRYNCPKYYYEWFKCKHCGNCAELWGDTKEQLIKKITTAIFRSEVKSYKKFYGVNPTRIITRDAEKQYLKIAKEIVEFLGVEE